MPFSRFAGIIVSKVATEWRKDEFAPMETSTIVAPSIFVSVQHVLTKRQSEFVRLIDRLLENQGFQPVTIGRTIETSLTPLETIREVISLSYGTVVIAFKRIAFAEGREYPKSSSQISTNPRLYPTVWNQIEAAMTFQLQHPLLILSEEALFHEGIIDPSIFPISPFILETHTDLLPVAVEHAILDWLKQLISCTKNPAN